MWDFPFWVSGNQILFRAHKEINTSMCVGQQLKNKTAKQSILSQAFLDFLGKLLCCRVDMFPICQMTTIISPVPTVKGCWVNSFNPLDFSLLTFFTILPSLQVKLNPLLINEKYRMLFPHSHNCISLRSACKASYRLCYLPQHSHLLLYGLHFVTPEQGA